MTDDLIRRLESATEGSPELDGRIWCALNGKRYKGAGDHNWLNTCQAFYTEPPKRTHRAADIERVSRSLDAALTLVPEGCDYYVGVDQGQPKAKIFKGNMHRPIFPDKAPTPALALCIAALKAREGESG